MREIVSRVRIDRYACQHAPASTCHSTPFNTPTRMPLRRLSLAAAALAVATTSAKTHPNAPVDAGAGSASAAAVALSADSLTPRSIAALEARIRRILDSTHTPGAGVAIVRHDSVIYTGGLGRSRLSPARNATAATLFRIGSTSKIFVSLTALALEHEGKLSLGDPLSRRMPGFWFRNPWEQTDTLRLVHLLEHTSGFDDNSIKAYANSDPTPLSLAAGLALDSTTRVSRWRPGTRFAYCNTGPGIVALITERIEGKPFETIVQQRWFDRIGMRTATYLLPDTLTADLTTLYRADGVTAVPYWHLFARPAGAINASAHDMAALLRFLLGRGVIGGDTLLPPGTLDRAEHASTWIGARTGIRDVGYGLGLYRQEDDDGRVWTGHAGGVEGGISDLSYLPAEGVGYALQINAAHGGAMREISKAVRAYLTRDLPRPRAVRALPLSPVIAREFAGWYRPVSPRPQIVAFLERIVGLQHLGASGQTVRLSPLIGAAASYVPVDSLLFRTERGAVTTMSLHRDAADGRAHAMDGPGGGTSFERIGTATALTTLAATALWVMALIVSVLAAVWGSLRWVVRRVGRGVDATKPGAAAGAVLWRISIVATGCGMLYLVGLTLGFQDVHAMGTVSAISLLVFATPIVFAVCAVAGLALMFRGGTPIVNGRQRASLWLARCATCLHLLTASYLARHDVIGWRPWV